MAIMLTWAVLNSTFPLLSYTSVFRYLYPIWIFAMHLQMGGYFTLMPSATSLLFGPENNSFIIGLSYSAIVSKLH